MRAAGQPAACRASAARSPAFTRSARRLVSAVLVAGHAGSAASSSLKWATAPTYAPLFSNLAGSDASAIVDKLDADGVRYQLTDGGQTVLVPKDQVYAERIKLSGAGLPAADGQRVLAARQAGRDHLASSSSRWPTSARWRASSPRRSRRSTASRTAVVHLADPAAGRLPRRRRSSPPRRCWSTRSPVATLSRQQVQSDRAPGRLEHPGHAARARHRRRRQRPGALRTGRGGRRRRRSRRTRADDGRVRDPPVRGAAVGARQGARPRPRGGTGDRHLDFDSVDTTTEQLTGDPKAPPLAAVDHDRDIHRRRRRRPAGCWARTTSPSRTAAAAPAAAATRRRPRPATTRSTR